MKTKASTNYFTPDEYIILIIYSKENREKTIQSLKEVKAMLGKDEEKLAALTDSVLKKLGEISDSDFLKIGEIQDIFS